MREIVVICYEFHNSIFLLRFCNELASYERETLRFINNYNSTTSLYERVSNRLLVTFRNENMLYDQQQQQNNIRRCLLPRAQNAQASDRTPQMVEPALFDIYLCDNCDAELYSLQAYKEHELGCQLDDDVIICEPDDIVEATSTADENHQKLSAFLSNLNLHSNIPSSSAGVGGGRKMTTTPQKEVVAGGSPEKPYSRVAVRRGGRAGVVALSRCPNVPFSSPLGQFLIQKSKSQSISEDYVLERLERIERFSYAPSLENPFRYKWFQKKPPGNVHVSYRRTADHQSRTEYHYYRWPRRQFSTQKRDADRDLLNALEMRKCKPCSINIKKLSETDVNHYNMNIKLRRLNNNNYSIVSNSFGYQSTSASHNNHNKTRRKGDAHSDDDNRKSSKHGQSSSSGKKGERVVAFIDLCSSDEEEEGDKDRGGPIIEPDDDDVSDCEEIWSTTTKTTTTTTYLSGKQKISIPAAPTTMPVSVVNPLSKFDGKYLSFEVATHQQQHQLHGAGVVAPATIVMASNVTTPGATGTFPTANQAFILNLPKSQPLQPVYLFSNNNFYDKMPQLVKIKNNSLAANL